MAGFIFGGDVGFESGGGGDDAVMDIDVSMNCASISGNICCIIFRMVSSR